MCCTCVGFPSSVMHSNLDIHHGLTEQQSSSLKRFAKLCTQKGLLSTTNGLIDQDVRDGLDDEATLL